MARPLWTDGRWWLDVADRTVRTAAQAALGALGTAVVLQDADWPVVASTAGFAAVACVLMSLAAPPRSAPRQDPNGRRYADTA